MQPRQPPPNWPPRLWDLLSEGEKAAFRFVAGLPENWEPSPEPPKRPLLARPLRPLNKRFLNWLMRLRPGILSSLPESRIQASDDEYEDEE